MNITAEVVMDTARKLGFGDCWFETRTALNTGRQFEVAYVFCNGNKCLFAKRSNGKQFFYLCNEFEALGVNIGLSSRDDQ